MECAVESWVGFAGCRVGFSGLGRRWQFGIKLGIEDMRYHHHGDDTFIDERTVGY